MGQTVITWERSVGPGVPCIALIRFHPAGGSRRTAPALTYPSPDPAPPPPLRRRRKYEFHPDIRPSNKEMQQSITISQISSLEKMLEL